jgi:hypothetical protein
VNGTRSRRAGAFTAAPAPARAPAAAPAAGPAGAPAGGWTRFWFTPAAPTGLHAVRLLTGLLMLAWLLPLAGHVDAFFGAGGWFDGQAYRELTRLAGESPRPLAWSVAYLAGGNPALLAAVFWASVAAAALFTAGVAPRVTAVLAWVVAVSFTVSPALEYDADAFLVMFTFYLMLGYLLLGQREPGQPRLRHLLGPADAFLLGRRPDRARPSVAANVALRLIQLHFALILVTSGLHKLQFGDWWGGYALWFVLYPAGEATLREARAHAADRDAYLFVLSLAAYAVLAWQLAFPLFAWRHRPAAAAGPEGGGWLRQASRALVSTRTALIGGALVGWAGLVWLWRMPLLGPALVVGCLSYLTPDEWARVAAALGRIPVLRRLFPGAAAPAAVAEGSFAAADEPAELATAGGRP